MIRIEMIPDLQLQCFQMLPAGLKPSLGKNRFPMWNNQSIRKSPENKAKNQERQRFPPKKHFYLFVPLIEVDYAIHAYFLIFLLFSLPTLSVYEYNTYKSGFPISLNTFD